MTSEPGMPPGYLRQFPGVTTVSIGTSRWLPCPCWATPWPAPSREARPPPAAEARPSPWRSPASREGERMDRRGSWPWDPR